LSVEKTLTTSAERRGAVQATRKRQWNGAEWREVAVAAAALYKFRPRHQKPVPRAARRLAWQGAAATATAVSQNNSATTSPKPAVDSTAPHFESHLRFSKFYFEKKNRKNKNICFILSLMYSYFQFPSYNFLNLI